MTVLRELKKFRPLITNGKFSYVRSAFRNMKTVRRSGVVTMNLRIQNKHTIKGLRKSIDFELVHYFTDVK